MNKKIQISHEVPFCLLEWSKNKMDYQYCLPHLMEESEEYRNHFLKCKEEGIEIYLDNSLHELGESVSDSLLLKWLEILEPSTFFIPDVWMDKTKSVVNARRWSSINVPKNTTKTAVVQATSVAEALLCYQTYKDLGYKKIAFSYGADYYSDLAPHPNKDLAKAMGRFIVIRELHNLGVISNSDRVHLLGNSSPIEFGLYSKYKFIESIDTSSPIMATIDKTEISNLGLEHKPIACMNDCQDIELDKIDIYLLEYNVEKFKIINNLYGYGNVKFI